jgi:hypothetical protein
MIAHVAEAGEGSGRVVLHMAADLSPVALDAALLLARGFRSEIEGLYTEDRKLFDLAAFPFAREISLTGTVRGPFDTGVLERRQRRTTAATLRRVHQAADEAGVRLTACVKPEDPLRALVTACAERGPWNVVVLGEPVGQGDMTRLSEMFASVWGTTAILVASREAKISAGPIVIVVEHIERFSPLLRTAEVLASVTAARIEAVLVGETQEHAADMEHHARLILGDDVHRGLPLTIVSRDGAAAVGEALRSLGAGFTVAQFNGIAVPADGEHSLLAEALAGPLLLVR